MFIHPDFIPSNSMPRFASMVYNGMKDRNHSVEIWTAPRMFYNLPFPKSIKKWLGYIDQFIIFPIIVRKKLKNCGKNNLFVFVDHALGPWIPLVFKMPHIIHCHDFLAQRSAFGEIPENKLKLSGKIYQKLIRWGYSKGENFLSVSHKTKEDLHLQLKRKPKYSEVVYNGLNQKFVPGNKLEARNYLKNLLNLNLVDGYILHVGGNQFYKNRRGVIEIYTTWRKISKKKLPLLLVGPPPTNELRVMKRNSEHYYDIHFLEDIPNEALQNTYIGAEVFLFPSLDEGFGWPIAEAMASGCMVITTNAAPMTEVGLDSCFYIPRKEEEREVKWAETGANILEYATSLSKEEREERILLGINNAKRFEPEIAIEKIERAYKQILEAYEL